MEKTKNNELSPLQSQVAEYLESKAGELVTFDELLKKFWPGKCSAENSADRIMIRKAIEKIRQKCGYERIQTIVNKGYSWVITTTKEELKQGFHHSIVISDEELGGNYTLARILNGADDYILEVTQIVGGRNSRQTYSKKEFRRLKAFMEQFD